MQAGPAPSWLWLCGIAYCQEGLTDGFIPEEVIDSLGVPKSARRLAEHLVKANLWEKADGGWYIHDYLDHNRSSETVRQIQNDKRAAGARGGLASGDARRKHSASQDPKHSASADAKHSAKQSANPTVAVAASDVVAEAEVEDGDVLFARFTATYPESGRRGGPLVEQAFLGALSLVGESELFAALENHVASEQWTVAKKIPAMDKWFRERRWLQRLDPPKGNWGTWKPTEAAS